MTTDHARAAAESLYDELDKQGSWATWCDDRGAIVANAKDLRLPIIARHIDAATEGLREENTKLRAALAVSKDPCIYCQLPADEMGKCKSGFPGCSRADDMQGCPEFGASMEAHDLQLRLAACERERDELAEAKAKAEFCELAANNNRQEFEKVQVENERLAKLNERLKKQYSRAVDQIRAYREFHRDDA